MYKLNKLKRVFLTLGVIIWIGALSPEIIVKSGEGCITDKDGNSISVEETQQFMESYFFDNHNSIDGKEIKSDVKFRLKLFEKDMDIFERHGIK